MQALTGQLVQNGQVVLDISKGNLEVEVKRDGSESWSGYFVAPSSVQVNNGQQYELKLTDGRSKTIEVSRINVYPTQTTVSFVTPI